MGNTFLTPSVIAGKGGRMDKHVSECTDTELRQMDRDGNAEATAELGRRGVDPVPEPPTAAQAANALGEFMHRQRGQ